MMCYKQAVIFNVLILLILVHSPGASKIRAGNQLDEQFITQPSAREFVVSNSTHLSESNRGENESSLSPIEIDLRNHSPVPKETYALIGQPIVWANSSSGFQYLTEGKPAFRIHLPSLFLNETSEGLSAKRIYSAPSTQEDQPLFDSGIIDPGEQYTYTFTTTGVYTYYSKTNPGSIVGVIHAVEPQEQINANVTEDSRTYVDTPGGLKLEFSPGSLITNTTVSISEAYLPNRPDGSFGSAYHVEVDMDDPIQKPITLTFLYDPDSLPPGARDQDLLVRYFNGHDWISAPRSIDIEDNTIVVTSTHLSWWERGIFCKPFDGAYTLEDQNEYDRAREYLGILSDHRDLFEQLKTPNGEKVFQVRANTAEALANTHICDLDDFSEDEIWNQFEIDGTAKEVADAMIALGKELVDSGGNTLNTKAIYERIKLSSVTKPGYSLRVIDLYDPSIAGELALVADLVVELHLGMIEKQLFTLPRATEETMNFMEISSWMSSRLVKPVGSSNFDAVAGYELYSPKNHCSYHYPDSPTFYFTPRIYDHHAYFNLFEPTASEFADEEVFFILGLQELDFRTDRSGVIDEALILFEYETSSNQPSKVIEPILFNPDEAANLCGAAKVKLGNIRSGSGVKAMYYFIEDGKLSSDYPPKPWAEGKWLCYGPCIDLSNEPPKTPGNPNPGNNANNQGINAVLSWSGDDPDGDEVTYDVYFADNDSNPDEVICDDVSNGICEPGTLSYNTPYFWKVVASDSKGLVTHGPVWRFTTGSSPNIPPNQPHSPSPADNTTSQDIATILSWAGGDPDGDEVFYNVYFAADDATPDTILCSSIPNNVCSPGTLRYSASYFWQVTATDSRGSITTSPVWAFKTASAPNSKPNEPNTPIPGNNAVNQGLTTNLGWIGDDPDGDNISYDVYLEAGDPSPDLIVCNETTRLDCDPGTLDHSTTYYWQVVATDEHGASTTGKTWQFTTEVQKVVGPLAYESHLVDDGVVGESNGDNDGIVECGEKIEIQVGLRNRGNTTATGIDATIRTSSSYVVSIDTLADYPDIPGGVTGSGLDGYSFKVNSNAPDGHILTFDLDITASNGGPWSDLLILPVHCDSKQPPAKTTTRVSVASNGTPGDDDSYDSAISAGGRYVAFQSRASNLVAGDTNGTYDVFVHDRETEETTRVSISSEGAQGNNASFHPSISANGRYVAFRSNASNLVAGDTNGGDVFIHDRQSGETVRVSVASGGAQGNGSSQDPSISADGRYVAFRSNASNLVAGDTNGAYDIFVHDQETVKTTRISIASDGIQGDGDSWQPSISTDGRYVAFHSTANNLVAGDTNRFTDVFVHDQETGETTRVSLSSDGNQGFAPSSFPSISADGRYVAFHSAAGNLVSGDTNRITDVFVHDRATGETIRISVGFDGSPGNAPSSLPSISTDGRYVAFQSAASNLVADDTNGAPDVFVHDRETGKSTLVSVIPGGNTQGDDDSVAPSISGDGRYVAFESLASNLVPGDHHGFDNIFVHDRGCTVSTPTCMLPPTNFGVHMVQIDEARGLNQAVEGGFRWARFNTIHWDEIEPVNTDPPNYDWSSVDEVSLRNGAKNDLNVIALVLFSPDWAHQDSGARCGPIDAEDLDDFAEFMGAVVMRYSQPPYHVKYWEMGNEPDVALSLVSPDSEFGCWGDENDTFYGGGYYAEMLKAVYPAIKQADPEAQVLVGGLLLDCDPTIPEACQGPHGDLPPKFLEGILANGGGGYFDGVAFHHYVYYGGSLGFYGNLNWNSISTGTGPALIGKANYIKNLLQQYGVTGKYLVSTETALLCVSEPCGLNFEKTKAYYAAEAHAASLAFDLEASIWYALIDNWRRNGLLERDLTELPAYDAMWFARRALPSTVDYLGEVESWDIGGVSGVRGYKFARPDRTVWILWSQSEAVNISLPANPLGVYDVFGNPLPPSNPLTLGVAPIYLAFSP